MQKLKIMSIFGTRPETSKMAPIIKELEKNEQIESIVCVTAQHRQMLDQALKVFDVTPDYDLNIMAGGQTLTDITTKTLIGLKPVFEKETPDMVLVHGDTSTTFGAALASFYSGVKVGHIEAGLRTFNKYEPFPEEMNRLLTTQLSDIYLAPTALSKENLIRESISADKIFVTGNTSVDSIKYTINSNYKFSEPSLNEIDFQNKKVIVMTAHRRENIGAPLEEICETMLELVNSDKDLFLVYAVHLNPLVQQTAEKYLGLHNRILLTPPLDMFDMHNLMSRCHLIVTDSGGLQEEAPAMKKPVVVLRNVTERPEGLKAGTLTIAGTTREKILSITRELLKNENDIYSKMSNATNPFGDGFASKRIVDSILYYFGKTNKRPDDFVC